MSKTSPSWHIRRYRPGDESGIIDLLNLVFDTPFNIKTWMWKYRENPVGSKILIAEDKGRIVAHYGLTLHKIKIGKRTVTGSQALDAVTHPNYQGQGIFVKMGREILSLAGREEVPISYGFPNEAALPGHRKVEWIELCNSPILVRPLDVKGILKRYVRSKSILNISSSFFKVVSYAAGMISKMLGSNVARRARDISVKQISSFGERSDQFWMRVAPYYQIIQERDARFLNWRFISNPDKRYGILAAEGDENLLGYIVLGEITKHGMKGGAIIDILTVPDSGEIAGHLISKAIQLFRQKGSDYVACLMRKGSVHYRSLVKHGFIPTPFKVSFIVHLNSESVSQLLTVPLNKWFFTWGDSDFM